MLFVQSKIPQGVRVCVLNFSLDSERSEYIFIDFYITCVIDIRDLCVFGSIWNRTLFPDRCNDFILNKIIVRPSCDFENTYFYKL